MPKDTVFVREGNGRVILDQQQREFDFHKDFDIENNGSVVSCVAYAPVSSTVATSPYIEYKRG